MDFMTGSKNEKKKEPTLHDVLAATQALDKRFSGVDSQTSSLGSRLNGVITAIQKLDDRLTTEIQGVLQIMDTRFLVIDKKLVAIHDRVGHIDERLGDVQRRLGKVEVLALDMQDDLRGALAAIDDDSVKVLDHEKRIRRIEKVR
jgi:hypothetical protein